MFKKIGLYYWSENAKLLCFALVVLGVPLTVVLYIVFYILLKVFDVFNLSDDNKNNLRQA